MSNGMYEVAPDGKWAQRVTIAGEQAGGMEPVDLQSRYNQTIQTHNAVSVGASGNSYSYYVDCNGFNDLSVILKNDATIASSINVYWSVDGTTDVGADLNLSTGTSDKKAILMPVKARYCRVRLNNEDSSVAHTMSAWAFLKV